MIKLSKTLLAASLLGLGLTTAQAEGFCTETFDLSLLPDEIAGRPGTAADSPFGGPQWSTRDPISLSIEWSVREAPDDIAQSAEITEQLLSETCLALSDICSIELRNSIGIVEQPYNHMGSSLRRILIFSGDRRISLRAIAPPAEADWLEPALDTVFDTMIEPMLPPC